MVQVKGCVYGLGKDISGRERQEAVLICGKANKEGDRTKARDQQQRGEHVLKGESALKEEGHNW